MTTTLLIIIAGIIAASLVATFRAVARDGYRRIPTRVGESFLERPDAMTETPTQRSPHAERRRVSQEYVRHVSTPSSAR